MWSGEVHVVIRVRRHGTGVPLDLNEHPALIGGGETRLPDQWGVAPLKEGPDETLPANFVLHLAGTFDDGLHHLQSSRGPMDLPVVSPCPGGLHGGGGARTTARPLRGRPPPREAPQEPPFDVGSSHGHAPWRRENHFEGQPGESMVGEEHAIVGPYVRVPLKSPEDVDLLDRRALRWSQVVHSKRAQREMPGDGPVVPIGNHRQDVASVRFGGRDFSDLQDVNLRADKGACLARRDVPSELRGRCEDAGLVRGSTLARSQGAPTSVPGRRRWPGELVVGSLRRRSSQPRAPCSH